MSFRLREIIKDPDKRAVISWLGGGAVLVAGSIWAVFTFVVEHKDWHDDQGAEQRIANRAAIPPLTAPWG